MILSPQPASTLSASQLFPQIQQNDAKGAYEALFREDLDYEMIGEKIVDFWKRIKDINLDILKAHKEDLRAIQEFTRSNIINQSTNLGEAFERLMFFVKRYDDSNAIPFVKERHKQTVLDHLAHDNGVIAQGQKISEILDFSEQEKTLMECGCIVHDIGEGGASSDIVSSKKNGSHDGSMETLRGELFLSFVPDSHRNLFLIPYLAFEYRDNQKEMEKLVEQYSTWLAQYFQISLDSKDAKPAMVQRLQKIGHCIRMADKIEPASNNIATRFYQDHRAVTEEVGMVDALQNIESELVNKIFDPLQLMPKEIMEEWRDEQRRDLYQHIISNIQSVIEHFENSDEETGDYKELSAEESFWLKKKKEKFERALQYILDIRE